MRRKRLFDLIRTSPGRFGDPGPKWCGIMIAFAILVTTAWSSASVPAAGAVPAMATPDANGGGDYDETLAEIKRRLDEAAEEIINGRSALDLGGGMSVLDLIDAAEMFIEQILDPGQVPSLQPPDAGEIDDDVQPQGLGDYAMASCLMALDAVVAVRTDPDGSDELVGTKLRTIRNLLPEYRRLAGL